MPDTAVNIIEVRGLWTVFGDVVVHKDLQLDGLHSA